MSAINYFCDVLILKKSVVAVASIVLVVVVQTKLALVGFVGALTKLYDVLSKHLLT